MQPTGFGSREVVLAYRNPSIPAEGMEAQIEVPQVRLPWVCANGVAPASHRGFCRAHGVAIHVFHVRRVCPPGSLAIEALQRESQTLSRPQAHSGLGPRRLSARPGADFSRGGL